MHMFEVDGLNDVSKHKLHKDDGCWRFVLEMMSMMMMLVPMMDDDDVDACC